MAILFVYGSLRKGMHNYQKYLEGKSTLIAYGYVKGELYCLHGASYPALLHGEEDILGELYELDEQYAKEIDVLEGFHANEFENDYNKEEMEIFLANQERTMVVPVYVFNLKKEDNQKLLGERIVCNDYVQHMKQRSN